MPQASPAPWRRRRHERCCRFGGLRTDELSSGTRVPGRGTRNSGPVSFPPHQPSHQLEKKAGSQADDDEEHDPAIPIAARKQYDCDRESDTGDKPGHQLGALPGHNVSLTAMPLLSQRRGRMCGCAPTP